MLDRYKFELVPKPLCRVLDEFTGLEVGVHLDAVDYEDMQMVEYNAELKISTTVCLRRKDILDEGLDRIRDRFTTSLFHDTIVNLHAIENAIHRGEKDKALTLTKALIDELRG